ncbi:hypothetical protein CY35_09G000700 [Sphagnum magellanicum]|nr:hypothetical protein CY35_09G000700 [Sphagnum magellanicum]
MVSCVQHCFYELLFLLVCTAAVMFEGICCGSVAVFTSQNLADVQALLDFRNALVDPSNALSSWKAENATSFCTWTGVECDIDGRVQTLKLSNIGLQGSISPSVAQLARLEVLDLSVNDLSGPIPPVCQSGQLKHLILTGNKLSGGLPQNLSLCTSLLRMRLGNNVLTGSIPPQIGQMKNLSYFEADSNQLVGSIPPELSGCNLSFLSLSSNNLTGLLPSSLGQLKFLESVTVANNQLDGNLPEELGQIAVLQSLSLANNRFSGPIPEAFGNILQLNSLDLSDNLLNGSIPSQLGNLQELESLQLSGNRIVGGIPSSFKNLKRLFSLDIAENLLTGFIPPELGSILSLQQVLNLSHNALMGNIPPELAQLNKLVSLDLSYNNLSGEIPPSLVTMLSLLTLDLAFNNFSGRVPECIQCHKNFSASSFIGNPGLCGLPLSTNCLGNGPGSQSSSGHGKLPLWASIVIGIGVFVTLMTIIAVLFGFWHFWSQLTPTALHPHLQPAPEGKELAVKCLKLDNENSLFNRRFTTELVKLDKVRHPNIQGLIGFILRGGCIQLLYNFMPNGSLGEWLHGKSDTVLSWSARYKIAASLAQGLSYLHHDCQPAVIHHDLNSNNVLLDAVFEPRIADVGIAKLFDPCKDTQSMTAVAGSIGYIAPEYAYTMRVTEKSNVYSYGVILLELLTGRKPVNPSCSDATDLVAWVHSTSSRDETPEQVLDANISTVSFKARQEMLLVLKIAILCTLVSPSERPEMKEVVNMLQPVQKAS